MLKEAKEKSTREGEDHVRKQEVQSPASGVSHGFILVCLVFICD